ncbi:MAG: MmcQ/YjbR family DNA-binding protein [Acidimicrobiales bacterium]
MTEHTEVSDEIVAALRAVCLALPEVSEEQAWVGTRWVVRKKNFAHVVAIDEGWPPAYARAARTDGPVTVLTFRSSGPELDALSSAGYPYFRPVWFPDIAGLVLEDDVDWDLVTELVRHSYCVMAPKKLAALVDRPTA